MATQNWQIGTTIKAEEDLTGCQYHGISLDDGELAVNGLEASGILLNKPKSGEFLTLGWLGEFKFHAGEAIAIAKRLTVTASGFFTEATSGDYFIGRAKSAVTSGSYGTGFFNFSAPQYQVSSK